LGVILAGKANEAEAAAATGITVLDNNCLLDGAELSNFCLRTPSSVCQARPPINSLDMFAVCGGVVVEKMLLGRRPGR